MITSLRLVDFKNFRDATLGVGSFTVIVGANASGKSNIRDAFRFLHGIGRGYTLAEIAGGRYGPGGQQEWEPIRGATTEIAGLGQPGVILGVELSKDVRYSIQATLDPPGSDRTGEFRVNKEELVEGSQPVFRLHGRPGDEGELRMASTDVRIRVRRNQPALTQIHEQAQVAPAARECARRVTKALASMRFLDLTPDRMRQPAFPSQTVLGDRGENLPSVLRDVCADPQYKRILIDWIDELSPAGVKNLEFRDSPFRGRVELGIREENDLVVSADSASDGTLRLLGVLAALLGKDPAGLYFFEEIENGIHPARLWLLIDLIEKWTVKADIQVVTTTHSPTLLCGANDDTFEHTSVVWREEHAARAPAIIRPLADLPDARSLRKSQGLDRLHHSGWMETALAFTHDRHEGEEGNE